MLCVEGNSGFSRSNHRGNRDMLKQRETKSVNVWLLEMNLMSPDSTSSSVQRSTGSIHRDQTRLDQSCSQAFNKQRKWRITPSLSQKSCTERKKKSLKIFNKCKFIWSTDKEKWRAFFSGLALHMTAIWEYCVFWPSRVVHDRWQGRKSRAAGSSTDMQIAFSWLLNSAWYLSSGLQHVSLYADRKQLIRPATGGRTGSWRFPSTRWKCTKRSNVSPN